jgi:hypothetical protein
MTAAHAHTFHGTTPAPPQLPNTVKAIRGALPGRLLPKFQAELDEAIDTADLAVIDDVKGRWWAQAMLFHDPTIRADFEAAERGELEFFPSPFAKR